MPDGGCVAVWHTPVKGRHRRRARALKPSHTCELRIRAVVPAGLRVVLILGALGPLKRFAHGCD